MSTRILRVYFIQAGNGRIKIGQSRNVAARMADLQTSCPEALRLLAIVKASDFSEKALHERFKHLRVQGEWFESGPEILGFISDLRLNGPASVPPLPAPSRSCLPGKGPIGMWHVVSPHYPEGGLYIARDEDNACAAYEIEMDLAPYVSTATLISVIPHSYQRYAKNALAQGRADLIRGVPRSAEGVCSVYGGRSLDKCGFRDVAFRHDIVERDGRLFWSSPRRAEDGPVTADDIGSDEDRALLRAAGWLAAEAA